MSNMLNLPLIWRGSMTDHDFLQKIPKYNILKIHDNKVKVTYILSHEKTCTSYNNQIGQK